MQDFKIKVTGFFDGLRGFPQALPHIVAETATEVFKESFQTKSFDGKPWPAYKGKKQPTRGSLMLRSGNLMSTIRPTVVTTERVIMNAGSSKVLYAKIHNEGGTIHRAAHSENFIRPYKTLKNGLRRFTKIKKHVQGQGFTKPSYSIVIPQRQFMGPSTILITRIQERVNTYIKAL